MAGDEADSVSREDDGEKDAETASNAKEKKLVKKKLAKNTAPEEILATRVLTDEDFEAIRKRQAEKQACLRFVFT